MNNNKTKTKVNRCAFNDCNIKLKLTDYQCKCGNIFCNLHRLPEQHNCSYDYKNTLNKDNEKENLINKMKCISEKIKKI